MRTRRFLFLILGGRPLGELHRGSELQTSGHCGSGGLPRAGDCSSSCSSIRRWAEDGTEAQDLTRARSAPVLLEAARQQLSAAGSPEQKAQITGAIP